MKCLACNNTMLDAFRDFDYSQLAGLNGIRVVLCDVKINWCDCGAKQSAVEIWRLADLTRELEAAKTLNVKQIWCSFDNNHWSIAFEVKAKTTKTTKRKPL